MSIKSLVLSLALLILPSWAIAQPNTPCSTSTYNPVIANATGTTLYICTTGNIWLTLPVIPSGSIVMITTGTCSAGFTEATELNGKTLVGTLAANSNIGTTGGLDNITPSGTNGTVSITPLGTVTAPVFTGSALAAHSHELPWQIPTTTTIRQIAVATFGTGTSRAATAVSAAGTANTTSAAVALSQSVTAGTPAGTNSVPTFNGSSTTVGAQVFTGVQFDNRSAFTRVIFCKKS